MPSFGLRRGGGTSTAKNAPIWKSSPNRREANQSEAARMPPLTVERDVSCLRAFLRSDVGLRRGLLLPYLQDGLFGLKLLSF